MIKNERQMIKSIIVLSAISLIAGFLLAVVSQLTYVSAEELRERMYNKLNKIYAANYQEIDVPLNDNVKGFYIASDEDYYIIIAKGKGYGGDIELYISFSGSEIVLISEGSNSETPGISGKALNPDNYSQYYTDINGKPFEMGEDIDAAAGATKSSKGILTAVKNAVAQYKTYREAANEQ
ncbi:MAG: FMN-binding protein [Clostridia bacterium]|nr:FMN-binding protein [Clostridia bacterium]